MKNNPFFEPYIDQEFFEGLTGTTLIGEGWESQFQSTLLTACEVINAGCGGKINRLGLDNLSENQQIAVKKATTLLTEHYLRIGET